MGENELRRFVVLVLISELSSDKPGELVRLAVVRAKMAELLAKETSLTDKSDDIFMLGLFSLLPALLDTDIDYICEQLFLNKHLKDALVNQVGPYSSFLEVVISYEKRDKNTCLMAVKIIDVDPNRLHLLYLEAIDFTRSVLDEE